MAINGYRVRQQLGKGLLYVIVVVVVVAIMLALEGTTTV